MMGLSFCKFSNSVKNSGADILQVGITDHVWSLEEVVALLGQQWNIFLMDMLAVGIPLGIILVVVGSYLATQCWAKAALVFSLLSIMVGMLILILLIPIIHDWKVGK